MNGHHPPCPRGQIFPKPRKVEIGCLHRRLSQHRHQSGIRNGKHGGHYHLIAGIHHTHLHISAQNQAQRVETIADPDGIFRVRHPEQCLFKGGNLPPSDIAAGSYHPVDPFTDFLHKRLIYGSEVEEGIALCHSAVWESASRYWP